MSTMPAWSELSDDSPTDEPTVKQLEQDLDRAQQNLELAQASVDIIIAQLNKARIRERKSRTASSSPPLSSPSPQKVCPQYGNKCKFGSTCTHMSPQNIKPTRQCDYFARGNCIKGKKCTFLHGTQSVNYQARPCAYFAQGKCTKGNECTFIHDSSGTPSAKKSVSPQINKAVKKFAKECYRDIAECKKKMTDAQFNEHVFSKHLEFDINSKHYPTEFPQFYCEPCRAAYNSAAKKNAHRCS